MNLPLAQSARPVISEKAGIPPKPASAVVAPKPMPAKPLGVLPKPMPNIQRKTDVGAGPGAGQSAAGAALPSGPSLPRGARVAGTPGQNAPAVDVKPEKPTVVSIAGGKDGGPKSAKSTPGTTPAVLPKDKDAKKVGDKSGTNGEKGDTDGTETPRTGGQTPKRFSLYLKGLPTPTSEAEIKTFFGAEAEKVCLNTTWHAYYFRLLPSSSSMTL